MEQFRKLDVAPFRHIDLSDASPDLGHMPELAWLMASELVIDSNYQREIGANGSKNVVYIARNFDWSRFGAVIVAALPDGVYAIVDGQHRSTAAMLRGIEKVPCQIIFADSVEQAAAFVDINGTVTAMTPLQLHAARIAAGDPKAIALRVACQAGGVTICRYPSPANKVKQGETLAVNALARLLEQYGSGTLSLALRCITRSADGNAGLVRGTIVKSICFVLDSEPAYRRNEKALIDAFDMIDLETALDQAHVDKKRMRSTTEVALSATLFHHLGKHLKVAA